MKLKFILSTCLILLSVLRVFAQPEAEVNAYIERYKELAIAEQLRSGVPAAITLAQGIHESAAGKSELATRGNNHFGIKCKSTWTGETMLHDDDAKQECFRKYTSAEQSYIDHSDFLKASNRYHFLFDLDKTDYAGWASGLKRAGYATNPQYVKRLTDLVEKYNLQQFTYQGISQSNTQPGEIVPNNDKEVKNLTHVDDPSTYYKGLKGFWAKKGETLLPKALEKNIRYAKLLALNDLNDEPLPCDMFIFIEKKRRVGTEEFHTVKEGESMLLISQKEAMPLATLYQFNNLSAGQEPAVGERLALQYKAYETPKTTQQFLKPLETTVANTPVIAKADPVQVKKEIPREEVKPKEIVMTEPEVKTETIIEESTERIPPPVETSTKPIEPEITQVKEEVKQEVQPETSTFPSSTKEINTIPSQPEANTSFTTTPPRTETVVVNSESKEIIDPEKARLMEELLSTKRLDGTEPPVTNQQPTKQVVINESPFDSRTTTVPSQPISKSSTTESPIETIPVQQVVSEPVAVVAPDPIPEPVQIARTYNEPGIDDSVKTLKKKFDQFVYAAQLTRKMEAPKKLELPIQKPSTEVKKPEVKLPVTAVKKEEKKVEVKKPEVKKDNVQLTKTGIKRDAKAIAESKEKELSAAAKKKADAKKEAADKKKGDAKKGDTKGKKSNADDKKNATDKKKNAKDDVKKKGDEKSKADPKKKPTKKK